MKSILISILLTGFFAIAQNNSADIQIKVKRATTQMVYVCDSKGSVAFHNSKNCRGLQACKHEIKTISEAEATQLGRRRCQICY